jgi:carbamoyltransferase
MRVLGISAFYHDSAVCLIADGEVVAAAQEERFTRKKHDARFPQNALRYCLEAGNLQPDDVDFVAFYEKPFLKFERLLETYASHAPRGFNSFLMALPLWLKEKLFQRSLLTKELGRSGMSGAGERLLFAEHHLSHAASAFFPSPFEEAAVLTMDGVGEWATTSTGRGRGSELVLDKEIHFPHSLGLLYSAFTYYLGFRVNSGEYKVMGLAPYGNPVYVDVILRHLIDVKEDGSFQLDMAYFDYCTGLRMTNERFDALFGGPPRQPEQPLTQRHMDIAASIQRVTEMIVIALTRDLAKTTGSRNLCLAGGVALNCVANGAVMRDGKFDNIWVQPAAGDAGGALGAALCAYHLHGGRQRRLPSGGDGMQGAYLGPSFSQTEIESALQAAGARYSVLSSEDIIRVTARVLAEGHAVGWFSGRMEFGPRALGNRSILGDPRSPTMQSILNLKIKFRESFRPFAPAVLREDLSEWFDMDVDSPYMLLVGDVLDARRRGLSAGEKQLQGLERLKVAYSEVPAITHVDFSARVQTVHRDTNPRFHDLISAFKALTGCAVLINTSFNVRGEPIVCSPTDAFRCFMGTDLDELVVGNCFLEKAAQDPALRPSGRVFDPD